MEIIETPGADLWKNALYLHTWISINPQTVGKLWACDQGARQSLAGRASFSAASPRCIAVLFKSLKLGYGYKGIEDTVTSVISDGEIVMATFWKTLAWCFLFVTLFPSYWLHKCHVWITFPQPAEEWAKNVLCFPLNSVPQQNFQISAGTSPSLWGGLVEDAVRVGMHPDTQALTRLAEISLMLELNWSHQNILSHSSKVHQLSGKYAVKSIK